MNCLIRAFITQLKKDWHGGLNTSPCLDDWDCFKNSLSIRKFLNESVWNDYLKLNFWFIVLETFETLTKLPCPSSFAFFNFTNWFIIEWLNWRIWILLFLFFKFSISFDLILRRDNQIFNFFCLNFKHDFEFFIFLCHASILQI